MICRITLSLRKRGGQSDDEWLELPHPQISNVGSRGYNHIAPVQSSIAAWTFGIGAYDEDSDNYGKRAEDIQLRRLVSRDLRPYNLNDHSW